MQDITRSNNRFTDLSHKLFLMVILILIFDITWAQSPNIVTITLKSGLVVKGELVTMKQQEYVEIKTPITASYRIEWSDIQMLDFNTPTPELKASVSERTFDYVDSGYYLSISGGFPLGVDRYGYPIAGISISGVAGKSFNQHVNAGVLLGYDLYWGPGTGIIPLGIEFKGRMKKQGPSPYYYVQGGYGFVGYSDYEGNWQLGETFGGYFLAPGFGLMNKTKNNTCWFLQLGQKSQHTESKYWETIWDSRTGTSTPVYVENKIVFRRWDLKFGFVFN